MTALFQTVRSNYPTAAKPDLFCDLGGQWPSLINNESYRNTCAIRLSVAQHKSGFPIPQQFKEDITGNGDALAIKVITMRALPHLLCS